MLQTRATQACLAVAALAFLAVGVGHLVAPLAMVEPVNLDLRGVNAFNEIRANYGGMHFLMGLFFLSGVFLTKVRWAALAALAVFTSGLVLGRVVSVVADGPPGTFIWLLLVGELVVAAAAWFLLGRARFGGAPDGASR
ncbi:MAG TPA: DUF4345 domain-containing protein [Pyrinomonadaceae bacterium]|jgi:hypothetical protein|nr:DUF4345 domain-containing protein [Pyrinomonadaceae bacterium]